MAEWWNLDQALIWITERSLRDVEEARGDPAGAAKRQVNFFHFAAEASREANTLGKEELDEGLGPLEVLIHELSEGNITAIRADDELVVPLSTNIFNTYRIEPFGRRSHMALAKIRSDYDAARGTHRDLLYVLLRRSDVVLRFPPEVSSSLISDWINLRGKLEPPSAKKDEVIAEHVRELHQSADQQQKEARGKRGRPHGAARAAAQQVIGEMYPGGLPREEGQQAEAIRAVIRRLKGLGFDDPSADTIKRAAGIRSG